MKVFLGRQQYFPWLGCPASWLLSSCRAVDIPLSSLQPCLPGKPNVSAEKSQRRSLILSRGMEKKGICASLRLIPSLKIQKKKKKVKARGKKERRDHICAGMGPDMPVVLVWGVLLCGSRGDLGQVSVEVSGSLSALDQAYVWIWS